MQILFKTAVLCLALLIGISCQTPKKEIVYPKTDLSKNFIIPKPIKVTPTESAFGLDKQTVIFTHSSEGFKNVGEFLSEKINSKINLRVPVNRATSETVERIIYINQTDTLALKSPEAYQLYIKKDSIFINAKTAAGAFRAVQTLRQLIPEKSNDTLTTHPMWLIPSGKIKDAPNFEYRGAMLDVARHFFTVEEVKKYIDLLAYYKYNTLHLHLSDDQGWRIEIKMWPKLTEVGGSSEVGGGKGGFYTQEDFKEIVAFAARLHIAIIPEIDMPGHTNAAIVSYPFLNGNGKTPKVYTGTRVGFSTFDTRKDTVYAFIDDVVKEIAAISPSPYFHIGGDESHVTKKRDYLYFVSLVNNIVKKHGKSMMGWDEVVNADISSDALIQHWRFEKDAQKAVEKGNKIILSPAWKMYLDMKYDSLSKHGLDWAGHITVDAAYQWNPSTYLKEIPKEHILGIEAPLWSETISNSAELEYLAFPRAIGFAELGWSIPKHFNWEDYKTRLAAQLPFLEKNDVNFYRSPVIDW